MAASKTQSKAKTKSKTKVKTTTSSKTSSKDYYHKNKKYRDELIAKGTAEHKAHRSEYARKQREYYASNESYRKYKRNYAAAYRKAEPTKSKAKKLRGKIK